MWKIKLNNKNEEFHQTQEESDLKMKTVDTDGNKDNSATKKLKQGRLPFQILSSKSSSPKVNSEKENSIKKRKLSEDSVVDNSKTKLCKRETKKNICKPLSDNEVVVIDDDSVELVENITEKCNLDKISDSNNCKVEEETKPTEEAKSLKKRTFRSEDTTDIENDNKKRKTKENLITSYVKEKSSKYCDGVNKSIPNEENKKDIGNKSGNDVEETKGKETIDPKTEKNETIILIDDDSRECVVSSKENEKISTKDDVQLKKTDISHIQDTTSEECNEEVDEMETHSDNIKDKVSSTQCDNKIKTPENNKVGRKLFKTPQQELVAEDEPSSTRSGNRKKSVKTPRNKNVATKSIKSPQQEIASEDENSSTPKANNKTSSNLPRNKNVATKSVKSPQQELASEDENSSTSKANNKTSLNSPRNKKVVTKSFQQKSVAEDKTSSARSRNAKTILTPENKKAVTKSVKTLPQKSTEKGKTSDNKSKTLKTPENKNVVTKSSKTPHQKSATEDKTSDNENTSLKTPENKKVMTKSSKTPHQESAAEDKTKSVSRDNDNTSLKTPENKNVMTKLFKTPQPESASKDSDSVELIDESPNTNTSVSKSDDGKTGTPKSVTKRRLTPKQILKQKESEKKREERKKQLEEKEQLKKEKEEKLLQMKEERQRLKLEKEKKKQIEQELKNEEKRAKEEEKKAKEEERKKRDEAKEEEKRKRDEAKEEERKKKEAEKKKEEKAASAFASFFTPKRSESNALSTSTDDITESAVVAKKFMPFEVKGDMRLATVTRRTLEADNKTTLDNALRDQLCDKNNMYIEMLLSKQHLPLSDSKTWPLQDDDDDDDDVIIIESEIVEEEHEKEKKLECEKKRLLRPRAKLLQFHENRRPPYWGTWRKKSSVIGPRKPFGQDNALFEYDIDSDDEWEEEEPGESLHGSDDEKESEDEYEVDNKVFVPHGYLSDEEGQDEIEDMSPEAQKAKLHFLELEFEAEMKEKTEKLKPRLIGCVWFNNNIEDPKSVGSHIAELLLSRRAVVWDNVTLPIEIGQSSSITSSPVHTPAKNDHSKINKSNVFPESAVPMLIKLVHGNRFKHKFLVEEFHFYMTQNSESASEIPSKSAISLKKREISEWMKYPEEEITHPMTGRRCWYISKEIRKKYGVLDHNFNFDKDAWRYSLQVPRTLDICPPVVTESVTPIAPVTKSVTPITKFTKVLTQEERQKQLVQSKTLNTSIEKQTENQVTLKTGTKFSKSTEKSQSKKVKSSVLDVLLKGKSKNKTQPNSIPTIIDIIELSPEKPCQDLKKVIDEAIESTPASNNLLCAGNSDNMTNEINDNAKELVKPSTQTRTTPVKPIKRIKPICLSPMKHKKKCDDKNNVVND